MKKIVLIEPQSKEDHVYRHVRMPRLGLPLLGTQLQQSGFDVKIYMGNSNSLNWTKILDADLVGVSTTTATCREAYQLSGICRSSGIPVVIGGIHATLLAEEALQFADYVVRGEAEEVFLPLIKTISEGVPPFDLPAVSYWHKGEPRHNPPAKKRVDMDTLPIPDLALLDRSSSLRSIPVMTSRGCPFNCSFCNVTQMFGRKYRYRCNDSVLEELLLYPGKHIFFCDDNFTANPKRSKELLQAIIDSKINLKGWGAQVRVDAARDDQLLALMKRSGCSIVYIGFESINPETLKGYNKQQTVSDIEQAIERFHDYGIRIHGMFVFGGEYDTVETIRKTVDFALETKIDSVQFLSLTPMPGTPLYDQLKKEDRIITDDWSLYDGHHTVFKPAMMPPEQMQFETVRALKKFYSLQNIFSNVYLTGWASALYRIIGWGLTRHFESRNRWFKKLLQRLQQCDPKPVTLFYRLLNKPTDDKQQEKIVLLPLKISLTEKKGIFYLKLRGLVGNLHLKQLKKTVRGLLPRYCSQLVVNTTGVRFDSEKAAKNFVFYLNRLGSRVRRLQIVTAAENQVYPYIIKKRKGGFKPPRFELLMHR